MPEDEKEAFCVAWFCVDPDYQGEGLGSKLLDLMINKRGSSERNICVSIQVAGQLRKKLGFFTRKGILSKQK